MKTIVKLVFVMAMALGVCCGCSQDKKVLANGMVLHYQVAGKGEPVVLLHGNGGSHADLDALFDQMVEAGYKVYAMDSRGHGANRPVKVCHYSDMAADVYQFCKVLNIEKPIVFGWSDGGIVALMAEMAHPGFSSVIAAAGANIFLDEEMKAQFDGLLEGVDRNDPLVVMMMNEPNIEPAELAAIQCPTLICAGENDVIPENHTRLIAENIPNSTLVILPGEDHTSFVWHSPKMGEILLDYLAGLE